MKYFLIGMAIVLVGWFMAAVVNGTYVNDQCRNWGWQGSAGSTNFCIGELNSGAKVYQPLNEIKNQVCIGPYYDRKEKCPSGIFFGGHDPHFGPVKLKGK